MRLNAAMVCRVRVRFGWMYGRRALAVVGVESIHCCRPAPDGRDGRTGGGSAMKKEKNQSRHAYSAVQPGRGSSSPVEDQRFRLAHVSGRVPVPGQQARARTRRGQSAHRCGMPMRTRAPRCAVLGPPLLPSRTSCYSARPGRLVRHCTVVLLRSTMYYLHGLLMKRHSCLDSRSLAVGGCFCSVVVIVLELKLILYL